MMEDTPIGGYAPGPYYGNCVTCKQEFQGHKHARQCRPCAVKAHEAFEALTEEQQAELIQRNADVAAKFFQEIEAKKRETNYTNLTHDESNYIRDHNGNIIAQKR